MAELAFLPSGTILRVAWLCVVVVFTYWKYTYSNSTIFDRFFEAGNAQKFDEKATFHQFLMTLTTMKMSSQYASIVLVCIYPIIPWSVITPACQRKLLFFDRLMICRCCCKSKSTRSNNISQTGLSYVINHGNQNKRST